MQQEARSEYTIKPYPEQITGGMKEGEAVCFRLGTDFVEGRIEAVVTKPGLEVGGQKIEKASINDPKYVVRDIDTQQMHVLDEKSLYPADAKQVGLATQKAQPVSNRRPSRCKRDALPLSYAPLVADSKINVRDVET
ncbi:hypothetical protein QOT17_020354 [Balamuthia mandrillaris]